MTASSIASRLSLAAEQAARFRLAARDQASLLAALRTIKSWQSQRLSMAHRDFLESPRYRAAALFFVEDLYGTGDHQRRDSELARVIPTLNRFLPEAALETICDAVELDALSESLDHRVAEQLMSIEQAAGQPFAADRFDAAVYARAYHAAGRFDERDRQIAAVDRIGRSLDRLVRKPLVNALLQSMAPAARAAGLGAMHEFLRRGFAAFKSMRGADEFLATVLSREQGIARALAAQNAGLFERYLRGTP